MTKMITRTEDVSKNGAEQAKRIRIVLPIEYWEKLCEIAAFPENHRTPEMQLEKMLRDSVDLWGDLKTYAGDSWPSRASVYEVNRGQVDAVAPTLDPPDATDADGLPF